MKTIKKYRIIKQTKKSIKEDREALEALIRRLRAGEISAFYYGPADDPDYKHSLLIERNTETGENSKTTYEYMYTKEIGEGGRIRITGADVSVGSCLLASVDLVGHRLARGYFDKDVYSIFKWREINHNKQ